MFEFLMKKDVLPEFNLIADHMTKGPCIALEVRFIFILVMK